MRTSTALVSFLFLCLLSLVVAQDGPDPKPTNKSKPTKVKYVRLAVLHLDGIGEVRYNQYFQHRTICVVGGEGTGNFVITNGANRIVPPDSSRTNCAEISNTLLDEVLQAGGDPSQPSNDGMTAPYSIAFKSRPGDPGHPLGPFHFLSAKQDDDQKNRQDQNQPGTNDDKKDDNKTESTGQHSKPYNEGELANTENKRRRRRR